MCPCFQPPESARADGTFRCRKPGGTFGEVRSWVAPSVPSVFSSSTTPDRSPSRMQTMPGKSLATCNKPEAQAKGIERYAFPNALPMQLPHSLNASSRAVRGRRGRHDGFRLRFQACEPGSCRLGKSGSPIQRCRTRPDRPPGSSPEVPGSENPAARPRWPGPWALPSNLAKPPPAAGKSGGRKSIQSRATSPMLRPTTFRRISTATVAQAAPGHANEGCSGR